MEDQIITRIIKNSNRLKSWSKRFTKKRYLYDEVKQIDQEYFVGIKGIRGIGKTVLMLQLARETEKSIYFSADSIYLKPYSLYEIVEKLVDLGYENIFIDEIHIKQNWQEDLKTIYDERMCRVIFSGSSSFRILNSSSDLSRRIVLKELLPVSFREYLNIRYNLNLNKIEFEDIIEKKFDLINELSEYYKYYNEYLEYGGVLYPKNGFYEALENSLRKVILEDMLSLREIDLKYEESVYKILCHISKSKPFECSYNSISNEFGLSKNFVIRIINDLERSGILIKILPCSKKDKDIKKEPKLYLTIPIRKLFEKKGFNIEIGSLREEFFVNSLRMYNICYLKTKSNRKTSDFLVNNIVFEIGGKTKKDDQNADYIVVDSLDISKNKIPLILFGFLY